MKVKTTGHIASPASTSRTGLSAMLGGLFGVQGSGARKISRERGVSLLRLVRGPVAAFDLAPRMRACIVAACLASGMSTLLWVNGLLPALGHAYATLEGPPVFSSAPGLPDGRVYEQVSPADKNGNSAGANSSDFDVGGLNHYGLASADGNSVLFEGTGPMGESPWAESVWFVATKNHEKAGWSTHAALPAAQQGLHVGGTIGSKPVYLDPSPDLSHVLVEARRYTLAPISNESCGGQIFLAGPDPFLAAAWLERPEIENPVVNCQAGAESGAPAGGTPDFSTVYFTYPGTLLPEDAKRASHAGSGTTVEAWGFYEDHEGELREAGMLPDGRQDPFGAVPAASGHGRAPYGNQVSADGSEAFFVSPDPASCEPQGHNDCAADPPELYVREHGEKTVLVSKDEVSGQAGSAPSGVLRMPNPSDQDNPADDPAVTDGSYVFASPDGSQAFFQAADRLTVAAPEGTESKTYDFDVDTGTLTYLPGVVGEIVATASDGSSFAFVRRESGGASAELDLWTDGPGGGSVTPVVQLPGAPSSAGGNAPIGYISEAQMSNDGSVLAFTTAAQIPGFNNRGTHEVVGVVEPGSEEIYRYDAPANTLGCVSCAPAGVTPSGDASMSALRAGETYEDGIDEGNGEGMVNGRGISSDGDRIFFDSPDPLVAQDTNTDSPKVLEGENIPVSQGRDVYEWENGVVYLISTGKSARDAYLLDSSENGNDVFFATTDSLVSGDTDGGFDVYDARIPHPGDNPPAAAVPCEGSVCQGPSNVPSPLTPPASATFAGLGNPAEEAPVGGGGSTQKKTTAKIVKCKKSQVKKNGKCVKRSRAKKSNRAKKASTTDRGVK